MKRLWTILAFVCAISSPAFSQTYILAPNPWFTGLDSTGVTIPSGKLCTYAAGTSTLLASYADSSGTANANPVVLDSAGRATVYLTSASYKFELRSATATSCTTGTVLRTQDNMVAPTAVVISGTANTVAKFNAAGSNVSNSTITDTGSAITLANPTTITTSVTTPLHVGGAAATQTLTLRSTSGVGTTDSIVLDGGNNGATDFLTLNSGGLSTTLSFTSPTIVGGTAVTSSLTLKSTTGVGTTDAVTIVGGNNGATTLLTLNTGGVSTTLGFTAANLTDSGLTITRVPFASTAGLLVDDADLTFATDTLTMTKGIASTDLRSPILFGGTAVGSSLTLKSTSGVGTTDSVIVTVGNNGATTALTLNTGGVSTTLGFTAANLTDTALTSTRVPVVSTGGLLADSANLTWSSPNLTIGAAGVTGSLRLPGSTSGTAILTAAAVAGTPNLTLPIVSGALMGYADARYEIVEASRDMTAATGSVSYTGAGFTPTTILAIGTVGETAIISIGFLDASLESTILISPDAAGTTGEWTYQNSARLMNFRDATGALQRFDVTSLDADGVTGTWTKSGLPTGTANFALLFFR